MIRRDDVVHACLRFLAAFTIVFGLHASIEAAEYKIDFERDSIESLARFGPISDWPAKFFPSIERAWTIGDRSAVGLGSSRALIATFQSGGPSRTGINFGWSFQGGGVLPCPSSVSFDLIAVGRSTGIRSPAGTMESVPLIVASDGESSRSLDVGPAGTRVQFDDLGVTCNVSISIVSLREWNPIVVAVDNLDVAFEGEHCAWPYGPVFEDGGTRPSEATLLGTHPLDQFGRPELAGGEPVRFALKRAAFNREWEIRAWFSSAPSELLYWNRVAVQGTKNAAGQAAHDEVLIPVPQPRRLRDAATGKLVDTLYVCAIPASNPACDQMSGECASTNSGLSEPAFRVIANASSPEPIITVSSPPGSAASQRTCFTLENIGDASGTVTLTPQHDFYILSAREITIPAGSSQRIDVVFTESGERESSVRITGDGVPQELNVPLRLTEPAPVQTGRRRAVRHSGLCD